MQVRGRLPGAGVLASAGLTVWAAPGLAQSVSAPTPVDALVVTATRTPTETDRIPARVEVISRDEIELHNYVTVVDALQATPGITIVQSGGAGTLTSVFSRGTNSKHTLALFDGIRLNDASSPNGQYNFGQDTTGGLERIEVVRGAGSAVYGSDAIGGVINFIPRVGGDAPFEPYAEVSVGDRETYRALGGATGTTGRASYGATVEAFRTSGFNNVPDRFANNLGEADGSEFAAFTGVADFDLTDDAVVRSLLRWRKADTDFDGTALDRSGQGVEDEYWIWRVGPRLQFLDDRLEVELEAGQVLNDRADRNDPDVNAPAGGTTTQASGDRSFANWRNTLSLAPAGALSDIRLSGGVEWQEEAIEVTGGFSDPLERSESAAGLYALAQARLAERVDLSASYRFDSPEAFEEVSTWNLGASVDVPEVSSRVYASVGTSFKAPTLSERFSRSTFNVGNPDLEPEEGESWEIGFDTDLQLATDLSIRFSGTWFDTEIENLIEYNVAQRRNVNVGVAEIEGYEAGLQARWTDAVRARVAYTYTDARNGVTDVRLLRRPPHQWSASLVLRPATFITVTMDYLRRGSRLDIFYTDRNPFGRGGGFLGNRTTEPYEVYSGAVTWQVTPNVSTFASVRNFWDAEYEEPNSFRGEPRLWTVGLRGRF